MPKRQDEDVFRDRGVGHGEDLGFGVEAEAIHLVDEGLEVRARRIHDDRGASGFQRLRDGFCHEGRMLFFVKDVASHDPVETTQGFGFFLPIEVHVLEFGRFVDFDVAREEARNFGMEIGTRGLRAELGREQAGKRKPAADLKQGLAADLLGVFGQGEGERPGRRPYDAEVRTKFFQQVLLAPRLQNFEHLVDGLVEVGQALDEDAVSADRLFLGLELVAQLSLGVFVRGQTSVPCKTIFDTTWGSKVILIPRSGESFSSGHRSLTRQKTR